MVVTDFDGTLLRSDSTLHEDDLDALREAGRRGVVRVLATGRSVFSLRREVEPGELPVDYVVFSSGAGVIREPSGELVRSSALTQEETALAVRLFVAEGLDFMVHDPLPENHRFRYHDAGDATPDFHRRIGLYEGYCRPLTETPEEVGPAAQLLAVVRWEHGNETLARLKPALEGLSLIHATSPLDRETFWLEVFPPGVSKSGTVAFLAERHGVTAERTLAIGNDYNDVDLLEWAGRSYVTANAPEDLKERFPVVKGNDQGGVAEAIRRWLG